MHKRTRASSHVYIQSTAPPINHVLAVPCLQSGPKGKEAAVSSVLLAVLPITCQAPANLPPIRSCFHSTCR